MRLGPKIFLYTLALLTVPIIINVVLNYNSARESIIDQTLDGLSLTAETEAGYVLEFLNSAEKRTVDFSSDGFIRDSTLAYLRGNTSASDDLNNHLIYNKQSLDPTIYGINVFDRDGNIIASTDEQELGHQENLHDYYTQSLNAEYGQPYVSDVEYRAHFGFQRPSIVVAAPLTDKETGFPLGVIATYYSLDELNKVLSGERLQELGEETWARDRLETLDIYLVNRDRLLITNARSIDGDVLNNEIQTTPVTMCITETAIAELYTNSMGVPVLGASVCLANGWTLLVEVEEDEVLAGLGSMRRDLAITVAVIIVFVFLMTALLSRLVTGRFGKLVEAANQIAGGDLTKRVEVSSKDESGQFAIAFNRMAEKLEASYATLEERVWERTKELERSRTLTEAERVKMETLIMSMADGLISTDEKGVIRVMNSSAEQLLGAEMEKCNGKSLIEMMELLNEDGTPVPDDQHPVWLMLNKSVMVSSQNFSIVRGDGVSFPAYISLAPIIQHGITTGAIMVFRDITKEREIDKMKTEFIAIASHQLRSPLSIVKIYIELLLDRETGPLNAKQKKYLGVVESSNQRVINLVNQLLNITRLETGTMKIEPKPLRLEPFLKSIIKEVRMLATQHRCKVTFTQPEKKLPPVPVDEVLLRQVVRNLVENAIIYSPKTRCSITVGLKEVKKGYEITVADEGIGIPAEAVKHIFEKFFRADNASTVDPSGTGLGLYIASLIMKASGGSIRFETGKTGTTFFVTIPTTGMSDKKGSKGLAE